MTMGSLISMGVAGGMVPCPAALIVLLTAAAMGRILFGLALILTFSLGLAGVLILIGILTVTASKLTTQFDEKKRWIQKLPVFSSGVIMLLGVGMLFRGLLSTHLF